MAIKRIIIDTDPAISIPFCDIDDGLAIFLALNSPELSVEGITTVFGNSSLDLVTKVAKDLLRIANRQDIPIFKGAYNEKWLGVKTKASQFLINYISENPHQITLITLAPLTNIATAFKQRPELLDDLNQLIIMGGVVFPERLGIPFLKAEFNISKDPLAAKIVFSQPIEKTLIGLDVTMQVWFTDIHYLALSRANIPIANYLKKYIKPWLILNKLIMKGFHPHDPITLAYILDESMYKAVKLGLDVEYSNKKLSEINKIYKHNFVTDIFPKQGKIKIIPNSELSEKQKIKVCVKVDEQKFLKLLLNRLLK